jgi:competence protein ComEC
MLILRCFLPAAAFSCALGILSATSWNTGIMLAASTLALGLFLLFFRPASSALCLGALILTFWGLGQIRGRTLLQEPLPPCHVKHHTSRAMIRMELEIQKKTAASAGRLRYRARALASLGRGKQTRLCGAVDLYVRKAKRPLIAGQRVRVIGRLRPATSARNPLLPSSRLRLLSNDIGARFFALPQAVLVVSERQRPALDRLRFSLERVLGGALSNHPKERAILAAVILGQRQDISADQRRLYSRAGISHLLAVSGLHLGLVLLFVFPLIVWPLRRFGWLVRRTDPRRVAAVLTSIAIILYTLLTGGAPSTQRACIMAVACLVAYALGRAPDLDGPLALAAVGVLLWSPAQIFRPGFQMSFAAVLGISLFLSRRRRRQGDAVHVAGGLPALGRWMRDLFSITIVATLSTGPLVAHHFGEVSLWGLFVNLLAVPLTSFIILPLGLLGIFLGLFWLGAGAALLKLAAFAIYLLDAVCAAITAYPGGVLKTFPGWPLALAVLIIFYSALRGGRLGAFGFTVGVLLAVFGWVLAPSWPVDEIEVTFLDVGQGDSTLIRIPGKRAVLVDAGGSSNPNYDPGSRVVLPYLRRLGVRRLDVAVATHPHADHVGGFTALLKEVEVGELWICWHEEESAWYEGLKRLAARYRIPVRRPRTLRWAKAEITPLWPEGVDGSCADSLRSTNDNSIVLRMSYGRSSILLAGDVESESELRLSALPPTSLRATVLKVPHHGSKTSSTAEFLKAVRPRLAVISCAVGNRFGFPHTATIARYAKHSIPVLRIDELGAVRLHLSASGDMRWSAPYTPYR